jgi:hypothetical protein
MSLVSDEDQPREHTNHQSQIPGTNGNSEASQSIQPNSRKTVAEAVSLLRSLKPDIAAMLNDQPLQLNLDEFAVMRRSEAGEADVMYIGPAVAAVRTEEHSRSVRVLGE